VALALGAQRLLGYLAVADQPERREVAAGRLWGECPEGRAQANLRNALWQARRASVHLVEATRDVLQLGPEVAVDLVESRELARRVIERPSLPDAGSDQRWLLFERNLLPTWDDEWLVLERERTRQLHLHALEALSRAFVGQGLHAKAVEAALAAVGADPLRDSARMVLIEAYLAEGNRCEALHALRDFRDLLRAELGIEVSPELEGLVGPPLRLVGSPAAGTSQAR
jgi:DNA-binding SARP family transcriptional activator